MFEIKPVSSKPVLVDKSNSKRFRLDNSFDIYKANLYLKSLNIGLEIEFKTYSQYSKLINQVNSKLGFGTIRMD